MEIGKIDYNRVKRACEKEGHKFFTGKPYDLNIFGVRSNNVDQSKDAFDDIIGVAYVDENGNNIVKLYEATTDPGLAHLKNPTFPAAIKDGTAILAPGQYPAAFRLGWHGAGNLMHRALVQNSPLKIFRDRNRDATLDCVPESVTTGMYGINLHAAYPNGKTAKVGRWSAGCQVIASWEDYKEFIYLCEMQAKYGFGGTYTYTLFLWNQILAA